MKNKKLITLLMALAVSVASVGALASCADNGEESLGGSSVTAPEESGSAGNGENSSTGNEENSSVNEPEKVITYTVSFQTDDKVTRVEVDEGERVEEPADPEKDYYVFDGWYNGETKWDFANDKVTGDVTLTAKWTAKVYTVKFVDANGETVAEKTYTCENVESFEVPEVPAAPKHYKDGAWDKDATSYLNYSEETVVVTATYAHIEYKVTYKLTEDYEVYQTQVGGGLLLEEEVNKPADPEKDYYVFDGWYVGDEKWDFAEDTVEGDVTLMAKWTAIEYTVKFVDFDKNETELIYTADNKDEFALPTVPDAPEHYENARWNKTLEDCLVFSSEAIVVEAIADAKVYTVSFNAMGGSAVEAQGVAYNEKVTPVTSKLDGYVFKAWTVDGEAYDMDAAVTGDMELVASWYKVVDGVDEVISAQTLLDGVQLEEGYANKEGGVVANPNASWYFDSDYNGRTGAGGTDDNKFAQIAKITLTYDGGAGTSETGRETYLVLPAINYKLYSKVDLAYTNNANIKALTIYGTEVAQYSGNNKLISIVTEEDGVYLYFREINSVGTKTPDYDAKIALPESVANGSEGLRLNITVGGWFQMAITEMHATAIALDYQANMAAALANLPENVEDLTGSAEESAFAASYLANEAYMTDAERVGYTTPAVIEASKDSVYCNAVVNAEAGSMEQVEAIEAYRAYSATLSEEQKAGAIHQANVATINAIIKANFLKNAEEVLLNDPIVDTSKGAIDQNERIQTGWGGHHMEYNTAYETYVHMIQFASGDFDGTATLPAINYNNFSEVYFGLYAIAGGNGTVSIAGQSFSFDNTKGHSWKVSIVNGVLTMTDDSKTQNDGGGVIFTAALPENVANGTTGLVIDFNFDAWSQAEITEMHTVKTEQAIHIVENNAATMEMSGTSVGTSLRYEESTYWGAGAHTAFNTSYTSQNLVSFNAADSAYTATFTLPKFNFASYSEAYFGFTAATAAGEATVTVAGASYTYDLNAGYLYVKMLVKDGVLTILGDGAKNADTVYATIELSEAVLSGSEALTITWSTAGWSQVEITEMQAVKAVVDVD